VELSQQVLGFSGANQTAEFNVENWKLVVWSYIAYCSNWISPLLCGFKWWNTEIVRLEVDLWCSGGILGSFVVHRDAKWWSGLVLLQIEDDSSSGSSWLDWTYNWQ